MKKDSFATPALKEGELWAGILLGKNGKPNEHIILLLEEFEGKWDAAKKWAKKLGGELPTRRMQSLLFANLKEEFKPEWYWSCEQHESLSGGAWGQGFGSGSQGYWGKDGLSRARPVRRLVI